MQSNNFQTESQQSPSFNKRPSLLIKDEHTGWKKLVKDIVRPPRNVYQDKDLGSKDFVLNNVRYKRQDFNVTHDEKSINVTLYAPENNNHWIILYLHGNSASKIQALGLLKYLPFEFSLASFDFIGCGLNEQADYISLGHRQAGQAESVIEELKKKGFNTIVWGRSMGAATALKYGKAPIIIADSSFRCFKSLCKQVAHRYAPKYVPKCLISCVFPCVFYKLRQDVKEESDYDLESLDILSAVKNIPSSTYVIFMTGDADILIDKMNSQTLYQNFDGRKKYLQAFPGTHNSKRPQFTLRKIMRMIVQHVRQLQEQERCAKIKMELQTNDFQ